MGQPIAELLRIPIGVTAFIGAGGKSELIGAVARTLPGTVLICSSYFYYPLKGTAFLSLSDISPAIEEEKLKILLSENHVVCTGQMTGTGKLGQSTLSIDDMRRLANYVLVEADACGGFPIKAHTDDEPRLPETPNCIVRVVGADGFNKPIAEAVDHPEVFRLLTGCAEDAITRPDLVAKAIDNERLPPERPGNKQKLYFGKRVFVNRVESRELFRLSEMFAEASKQEDIVIGSVKNNAYKIC